MVETIHYLSKFWLKISALFIFFIARGVTRSNYRINKIELVTETDYLIQYFQLGKRNLFIKPAREIYSNHALLEKFSNEDAAYIGLLVGRSIQLKRLKYEATT